MIVGVVGKSMHAEETEDIEMGQSVADTKQQKIDTRGRPPATKGERRLRQVSAWLILYLLLQAETGLAWDRNWHDLVGRDRFWIPPHIMMYSGLGGVGIVALALIVVDSIRYARGRSGVDDSSTANVFWLFHAPLGYILVGFGAFADLLAAPFDNYWHQLYGIDVTLWSPFHLMGTFGGVLAGLGSVYVFASEASNERQVERPRRSLLGFNGPEWGLMILLASFIELVLPSLTAFKSLLLGPVEILLYPLILTVALCYSLCGASRTIRRPAVASITVAIVWLESLLTQLFVPWALNYTVPRFGMNFRFAGREPHLDLLLVLLPIVFLLSALLVDGFARWQRRAGAASEPSLWKVALLGMLMALPVLLLPQVLVQGMLHAADAQLIAPDLIPPDIILVLRPDWRDTLVTLPIALLLGALIARLGTALGDIWHLSQR
jgi:hypothetical protein